MLPSLSMECKLPVGVARWFFSSLAMRAEALCIEPWDPAVPSRLDNALSWAFLDLKRKAMVG
jgi:hypothetical protein